MEDITGLLEEYLLVPKVAAENERDAARDALRQQFEDLSHLVLDEEIWILFLEDQYDITSLKTKLNSKNDQERAEIFKVRFTSDFLYFRYSNWYCSLEWLV